MSFYNHKTQFENNLKRIKESGELIKENKDIILKFKDYLLSEGLSVQRINRYISDLFKYNKILNKPFDEATKEDLRKVVEEYKKGKVPEDWWSDIPTGGQIPSTELLGFPTQKPEKLLEKSEVLDLLKKRPKGVDLVLTGRGAVEEIVLMADTVTEIKKIKHEFDKGKVAREGVNF